MTDCLLFATIIMPRETVDVALLWKVLVSILCNGSMKRFTEGVVCTGGLEIGGVWVIWYRKSTL